MSQRQEYTPDFEEDPSSTGGSRSVSEVPTGDTGSTVGSNDEAENVGSSSSSRLKPVHVVGSSSSGQFAPLSSKPATTGQMTMVKVPGPGLSSGGDANQQVVDAIFKKLNTLEMAQSRIESSLNANMSDFFGDVDVNVVNDLVDTGDVHHNHNHDISEDFADEVSQMLAMINESKRQLRSNDGSARVDQRSLMDRSVDEVLEDYEDLEKTIDEGGDGDGFSEHDHLEDFPEDPVALFNSMSGRQSQRVAVNANSNGTSFARDPFNSRPKTSKTRDGVSNNREFQPVHSLDTRTGLEKSLTAPTPALAHNTNSRISNNASSPRRANPTASIDQVKKSFGTGTTRNQTPLQTEQHSQHSQHKFVVKQKEDNEEMYKQELYRQQEAIIEAFQKDSQKLCAQLKKNQEDFSIRQSEWNDEKQRLQTEVETLKLKANRLLPQNLGSPRLGLAHKGEVERLNEESATKSDTILDLRREILRLNRELQKRPASAKQTKVVAVSPNKEKEYQKTIQNLNKQIRTLQKILFSRDPGSSKVGNRDDLISVGSIGVEDDENEQKHPSVAILEERVIELEKELARADADSRDRLKDFQNKQQVIKVKYEDRIKELEKKLVEYAEKIDTLENDAVWVDNQIRLDKSQAEISSLKTELNRCKRELEIAMKSASVAPSTQAVKQEAGNLTLAHKKFKTELAEKDKEILKMKKENSDLKKTNNHLKREREKYLNLATLNLSGSNTIQNARILRAKSDLTVNGMKKVPKGDVLLSQPDESNPSLPTIQLLQSTLESERADFEEILADKDKLLAAKEKMIKDLQSKMISSSYPTEIQQKDATDPHLIVELRERVMAQHKMIKALKEHLTNVSKIEKEFSNVKMENARLEYRVQELLKRCTIAETMSKPENEILAALSAKVEDLNSRYDFREKQMDFLVTRLSVHSSLATTMANSTVGSHHHLLGKTNGEDSFTSDLDLRQFSPTTTCLSLLRPETPPEL